MVVAGEVVAVVEVASLVVEGAVVQTAVTLLVTVLVTLLVTVLVTVADKKG